ncbi:MAG: 7-cyano-7-deazaguanine synthase QueC [Methanosarcinales archaeon]|nr:MAG: 7-cyano-7-deazaguanine synthase QueC [Methanosarcinales archaeon]
MNSVILLSAGLDSTVAFKHAYDRCKEVLCLTFDYGQQAAAKEIQCATMICSKFDVLHEVIELPWIARFGGALVGTSELPQIEAHELDSEKAVETARGVWVPARNLIFMAIAAGYAENYDHDLITVGLDFEEARTFPDNTREFVERFDRVLEYGTISSLKINAPLIDMNKVDIVRLGVLNGAPLELSWSCYRSGDAPCGVCESCLRRARAFAEVGVEDPGRPGAIAP